MSSHDRLLKRQRLAKCLGVAVLIAILFGAGWLVHKNRVNLGLISGEPKEYVAEVQHRFFQDQRWRIGIELPSRSALEDWLRKRFDARDSWFSSVQPVVEGRVAFFRTLPPFGSNVPPPIGAGRLDEQLAAGHFLLPRSKRADDPKELETVIWAQFTKEITLTGPDHWSRSYLKIVKVYNLSSGSYYESEEMGEKEVDQYVFNLVGG